jgi:hypothetical protein
MIRCALSSIVCGLILLRSAFFPPSPFSVVVSWMYNLTSFILPRNHHHGTRNSPNGSRSTHPDIRKIRNGHNIQHAPDIVRALPPCSVKAQLPAHPAMRPPSAPSMYLGPDDVRLVLPCHSARAPFFRSSSLSSGVRLPAKRSHPGPRAPFELVADCLGVASSSSSLRCRSVTVIGYPSLLLSARLSSNRNSVGTTPCSTSMLPFPPRALCSRIESRKKALDPPLVQHHLLEAADVRDRVRDAVPRAG